MDISFHKGYCVYESGEEPIFVTPHSGPAFEVTTSRDDYSETIASLCWQKLGGRFIVSNMSRKRTWGIDFNRDIPDIYSALDMYKKFMDDKEPKELKKYREKYAWVAKNEEDYKNRLQIYSNFWDEVKRGNFIVLIHRAFPRLKAIPSLMDLTTFDNQGIDKNILKEIIDRLNRKYCDFFKSIEKEYKNVVKLEQERVVSNIMRVYGTIELKKISIEFKTHLESDLIAIRKYAEKDIIKKLESKFTPENFVGAAESALKNSGIPKITVEEVFKGELATGPKKQLFPSKNKKIIQFEPTSFLNFWYPHKGADIICDIIEEVRKII